MAEYPSSIYSPRTKANKSGVVYDAAKTTVPFAEDVSKLDAEVVAIEGELGVNPLNPTEYTNDHTLALTDYKKLVEMNKETAVNLTIPLNSSVAFSDSDNDSFPAKGAGQVTVVATGGVALQSAVGTKTTAQHSIGGMIKIATDTWVLLGDLTT